MQQYWSKLYLFLFFYCICNKNILWLEKQGVTRNSEREVEATIIDFIKGATSLNEYKNKNVQP